MWVCFVCCFERLYHRRIFISFRCRFTLGAYRPEESKQRLLCFCLEWHFLILTVLPPISPHHLACHLVQSSPRHHFLSLSIASSTSPHFILYLCPSSAVFCLGSGGRATWSHGEGEGLEVCTGQPPGDRTPQGEGKQGCLVPRAGR